MVLQRLRPDFVCCFFGTTEVVPCYKAHRLPDDKLLGPRPPFLPDYFRDDVAAAGFNREADKTIAIQAAEILEWG